MKRQGFLKKAAQSSAWYLRLGSFAISLAMLFSIALYPTRSSEAFEVSRTAFGQELGEVEYKAIMSEPRAQNQSAGAKLSDAELRNIRLYAGGIPFGIKFITEGVLVVGFCDLRGEGYAANPSDKAGLKVGDRIISVDGRTLNSAEELTDIVRESNGRALLISYVRNGDKKSLSLTPIYSKSEGAYKTGIYVKDSGAGIGTVSYINPQTLEFGGLGHGVCEGESGALIPISKGSVLNVSINGIVKGEAGAPGELRGGFNSGKSGSLLLNNECGVFGYFNALPKNLPSEPLSIGLKKELRAGKAYIYTTLEGEVPQKYEVEISNIKINETQGKCFTVRVTDKTLLQKTGGIVQGMSGSPIIQNGKLVGAVTHVLINDPTTGYGIFIENMLNAAQMPMQRAA